MNKAREMLDALMGPNRDSASTGKSDDWKDRKICKKHLVGFCPYDKTLLGGRRDYPACPKVHNDILRAQFEKSDDAKPDSKFRADCERIAISDLMQLLADKEAYGKKQMEFLKASLKCRKLPEEVDTRIIAMKRDAMGMKERAERQDDLTAAQREHLERESESMLKEYRAVREMEERKAALNGPNANVCDVCGSGYKTQEEYKMHLEYRVHQAFVQVNEVLEQLKKKDEERAIRAKKKVQDENGDDKKGKDGSRSRDRDRGGKDRDRDKHAKKEDRGEEKKRKDSERSRSRDRSRDRRRRKRSDSSGSRKRRDRRRSPSRSRSRSRGRDRRRR